MLLALYRENTHGDKINKTRALKASVLKAIPLFQLLFQTAVGRRYSREAVCLARTFQVSFIQMALDANRRLGGNGQGGTGENNVSSCCMYLSTVMPIIF